ncbi:type II toxin-antitoxin system RelB/DinJ family antitoxin [Zymomonas mobilis]|uniref:Addiction module antitoxin, RelB/DinJ family n=1 Tax=Zymomonas mobilis subsp. mobilis (strain ATCC 31821 / ZM4 / CP4) TaxID=264203 RepID=A0A806DA69_ZYMMO|nr:type II toxin-antitoxin system RelB/DinJ family antitoxin [Zymomonas mobilis]ADC33779.1 addiction module antitoxin, RelB/DinJ family [Zymomonas mobilis subsp. mobilis ZM4 = ATCC 31821]AHB11051.1 addiction module antitoxin, RelB/DinJ family [Zymomonas mobilis subsp. mobilis str. CP4 = NRRL B-14023]AHJ71418.1 Antitoxin DinJ [Zymomonas mobilis subsp. mobilis NRRL B-12526]AHJ73259.1 Antitoxin DinJ [Zymomonas mobilis subsp. mobilis str. CP4 = NRRL B-14023]
MKADSVVRARIPTLTKEAAIKTLEQMGLSISDAIRLLMTKIANEQRLPFSVELPTVETKKAIIELENGKGKAFKNADALFEDLGI